MAAQFFIKGIVVGLWVAAPVGPIGALIIRRTLVCGVWSGFFSGLGAVTADGFYGAIAAYGLTSISSFLLDHQLWVKLVGGLVLLTIGINALISQDSQKVAVRRRQPLFSDYFSSLLLTLANPLTILAFLAVFAGLGIAGAYAGCMNATLLVSGVMLGSFLWTVALSFGLGYLRGYFGDYMLRAINLASGLIIVGFALYMLVNSARLAFFI